MGNQRLADLLNKFHAETKFLPEEIDSAYAYLFLASSLPEWKDRKSKHGRNYNDTLRYLKEMIARNELYTLTDIEAYYKKRHDDIDRLFSNLENEGCGPLN